MYQLVYVSTFGIAVGEDDVAEILERSRINNRRDGITGILIADGTRFLQVLEGDRDKVEAAFARIGADKRHFAIHQLVGRQSLNRDFGEWDMAYRPVDTPSDETDLARRADLLTTQLPDGDIKDRLHHFLHLDRQNL